MVQFRLIDDTVLTVVLVLADLKDYVTLAYNTTQYHQKYCYGL